MEEVEYSLYLDIQSIIMKKESTLSLAIAIGVAVGTTVGLISKNLGLWLSVGVAIGAGIGTRFMTQEKQ